MDLPKMSIFSKSGLHKSPSIFYLKILCKSYTHFIKENAEEN